MNPPPFMSLSWQTDSPIHPSLSRSRSNGGGLESQFSQLSTNGDSSIHLLPPPTTSQEAPSSSSDSSDYKKHKVEGEQIFVYRGPQGSFTLLVFFSTPLLYSIKHYWLHKYPYRR